MRLLILHHSLDENGCCRIATGLANHLVARGDEVLLPGVTRRGEWHYPVDARIGTPELTAEAPLTSSFSVFFRALPRLRHLIRETGPDAVIGIGTMPNVLALATNIGSRRPLIVNEQTDPKVIAGRRYSQIRNAVYRFARPDAFIVLTEDTARLVGEWTNASRVHVIPNPSQAIGSGSARPPGGAGGAPFVLAMGRLAPQKGFDLLLDAWADVSAGRTDWKLVIAGEGPDRAELEAQARRLGVSDSVEFPGFTRDPFALMAAAEVFVLSSRYEGFPMVLVEAMGCALPAVAMDCPSGPAEIVADGVDGFLIPLGDVQSMAAAMAKFMDDTHLRDEIGARAREKAERFAPARVWADWERVIDGVTA